MKKNEPLTITKRKTLTNSQFVKLLSKYYKENKKCEAEKTFHNFLEHLRENKIKYSATNFLKSDLYGIAKRISRANDSYVDIGSIMYLVYYFFSAVQDDWYEKMDEKELYLFKEDYPHPRSI